MKTGLEQRAEWVRTSPSFLTADVMMYATAQGGMKLAKLPGWACLLCPTRAAPGAVHTGYDGWPKLDQPLLPGDKRRLSFVFLGGDQLTAEDAAAALRMAGIFYLWEGRYIGEARVVA